MLEAPLLAHLFRAGLVQQLAHAFGPVEGIVWTCRWVWFTERLFSAILQMRFGEGKMALETTILGLTVTDTITGLVWQRDGWGTRAGCSGGADGLGSGNLTCSWSEAQSYCASLTLGGVSGWRLPGRNELSTLVDFTETNPCIDQTAFPNAPSDWFQTSSSNARSSG